MSSISQQGDGRWKAVATGPDGKGRFAIFDSQAEAERGAADLAGGLAHTVGHELLTRSQIRTIAARAYDDLMTSDRTTEELGEESGEWVDVRRDDLLALIAYAKGR